MVLVPVNFMLGPEEIAFILGHCGACGMVAEGGLAATADKALAAAGIEGGIRDGSACLGAAPAAGWEDVDGWWRPAMTARRTSRIADDDPLRLMYTSGTESRPKGVMLSSRSLISQYVSCVARRRDERG